jgi:hypothetical protein
MQVKWTATAYSSTCGMGRVAESGLAEIVRGVDAAGIILVLRRLAVERVDVWVFNEQHPIVAVAQVLNYSRAAPSDAHGNDVADLHGFCRRPVRINFDDSVGEWT